MELEEPQSLPEWTHKYMVVKVGSWASPVYDTMLGSITEGPLSVCHFDFPCYLNSTSLTLNWSSCRGCFDQVNSSYIIDSYAFDCFHGDHSHPAHTVNALQTAVFVLGALYFFVTSFFFWIQDFICCFEKGRSVFYYADSCRCYWVFSIFIESLYLHVHQARYWTWLWVCVNG